MSNTAKKTQLYEHHVSMDAKISNFGGYDMPLWYKTGPKQEHLAVIQHAGIFDTSHMAIVTVTGNDAPELLQKCHSKDLAACIGPSKLPLQDGKCVYGVFLDEKGGVIDDSLVYRIKDGFYMVIVNAGMGGPIAAHLKDNKGALNAEIRDYTDQLGKIDIQGPSTAKMISRIIKEPEVVLEKMPYFNFKGFFDPGEEVPSPVNLVNDIPILLSRTGYTGEFGFEILIEGKHTLTLWDLLKEAGEEYSAISCGLAARDSLRAGAVLPLSHQDIGDWPFLNNPWPFALPYDDEQKAFTKDFIGANALLETRTSDYTYAFSGFDPRKVVPGEDTAVVDESDNKIGVVLTCATDMAIDRHEDDIYSIASENKPDDLKFRGLSCGFIKTTKELAPGDIVYLTGNNRKFKVEIRADIRPARTARKAMKKML